MGTQHLPLPVGVACRDGRSHGPEARGERVAAQAQPPTLPEDARWAAFPRAARGLERQPRHSPRQAPTPVLAPLRAPGSHTSSAHWGHFLQELVHAAGTWCPGELGSCVGGSAGLPTLSQVLQERLRVPSASLQVPGPLCSQASTGAAPPPAWGPWQVGLFLSLPPPRHTS